MNKISYHCLDCQGDFDVIRVNPNSKVRCLYCGSMKTRALILNNTHRIIKKGRSTIFQPIMPEEMSGRFVCEDCVDKFDWSITKKGTPQCPKCSSVKCIALSPIAAVSGKGKEPVKLSKAQIKRIRFIRKNYEQRVKVERHFESFQTEFVRLGVSESLIKEYNKTSEKILEYIDSIHKKKIKEYDRGK